MKVTIGKDKLDMAQQAADAAAGIRKRIDKRINRITEISLRLYGFFISCPPSVVNLFCSFKE